MPYSLKPFLSLLLLPACMSLHATDTTAMTALHDSSQAAAAKPLARANGPEWLENAVFYQIYPQSYCDSNADGIGDIPGIISKLPYLKQLGITAIWLGPCYESPFGDAGYDVADFRKVAPRYGTNEDLVQLFAEAKTCGILHCAAHREIGVRGGRVGSFDRPFSGLN